LIPLQLGPGTGPLRVLALGAHPDDVEIGAGGTLLRLAGERTELHAHVSVLTSTPDRAAEARAAAGEFLAGAVELRVEVHDLGDGLLPAHWGEVKAVLETLATSTRPDVVLAPSPRDTHQDHRLIGELVRTSFRDHLVLHYEIPKWDGDLGATQATHYVPLTEEQVQRKCDLLRSCYGSQADHDWWDDATFRSLARLRGMECRAPYAEAFGLAKAVLDLGCGNAGDVDTTGTGS
jgi:LmbE family N-acetylglucosaminyl deacetylase